MTWLRERLGRGFNWFLLALTVLFVVILVFSCSGRAQGPALAARLGFLEVDVCHKEEGTPSPDLLAARGLASSKILIRATAIVVIGEAAGPGHCTRIASATGSTLFIHGNSEELLQALAEVPR